MPFFELAQARAARLANSLAVSQQHLTTLDARSAELKRLAAQLLQRRQPVATPDIIGQTFPSTGTGAVQYAQRQRDLETANQKYISDYQRTGVIAPFAYRQPGYEPYTSYIEQSQARQKATEMPPPTLAQGPLQGPPQPEVQPTAQEEQVINRAGFNYGQRGILLPSEAEQVANQPSISTLAQPIPVPGLRQGIEQLRRVPIAGPTLGTAAEFATSPAGIAAGVAAPELTALSLAGQIGAGTLGGAAEQLGAPRGTRPALELAGGLAGPFAPAAVERVGTNLATATERAGSARALLASEVGGTKPPIGSTVRVTTPQGKEIDVVVEGHEYPAGKNEVFGTRTDNGQLAVVPETAQIVKPAEKAISAAGIPPERPRVVSAPPPAQPPAPPTEPPPVEPPTGGGDEAFRNLVGGKAFTPALSKFDRAINAVKETLGVGVPEEATASTIMRERRDLTRTVESLANRLGASSEQQVKEAFKLDNTGRIQDLPGAPTIQDLAAKLPQYQADLTPRQTAVMENLKQEMSHYQGALTEVGIDLGTRADIIDGGFYLPRGRADIEGADAPLKIGVGGGKRGVRRGFERHAQFESMAAGINAGYRYAPFGEAMQSFGKDAGQRALEGHAVNLFQSAKNDLGEPLATKLAKDRRIPRGQGTVGFYGLQAYSFPDEVANAANKYLRAEGPTTGPGAVAQNVTGALNNLLRGVRATADVSFLGIQGLLGAVDQPQSYGQAVKVAVKSMGNRQALGAFINDFDRTAASEGLPLSREWLRAGLRMGGADSEFAISARGLGKIPGAIERAPVVRQANRAFGYFGDTLRLEGANALATVHNAKTPEEFAQIAESMNLMTGWSKGRFLGDVGNLVEFAPRFFQSQLDLAANALTKGGLEGDQARRALIKLVGVGSLLTVAANEAIGNKGFDYLTPWKNGRLNDNFMRIRFKGQDISLFGPWDSLLRGIVSTAAGDPSYIARTKASPLVGLAWDAISGTTFTGQKFDAESFLRGLLPFSLANVGKESLLGTAIGTTGLKATPETLSERRNALTQNLFGVDYNQLDVDQRQQADANPQIQDLTNQLNQQGLERGSPFATAQEQIGQSLQQYKDAQTADDTALQSGNMDPQMWKDNQKIRSAQQSAVRDAIYNTLDVTFADKKDLPPIKAALEKYFAVQPEPDPVTREVDWTKFFDARDAALSGLSPSQRQAAQTEIEKNLTPTQREFRQASRTLDTAPTRLAGLDKTQEKQLGDVDQEVDKIRDELAKKGLPANAVSGQDIYATAAERLKLPERFGVVGYILRPGTKARKNATNPDYLKFLAANQALLEKFYPKLYSRELERALAQTGGQ